MDIEWSKPQNLSSRQYTCGYCGNSIASTLGYVGNHEISTPHSSRITLSSYIYICHHCNQPTYFKLNKRQIPGYASFKPVSHLPSSELAGLYQEACDCFKVAAYTAVIMCCRKMLMNLAVEQGAEEGLDFAKYVDYINEKHLVPKNCKFMIAQIRSLGNNANHSIEPASEGLAKTAMDFVEMLLRNTYEYAGRYRPADKVKEVIER